VYAIGDLINTPQLAHVAYAEAILVTKDILGEGPTPVNYDRVPWAIYCHPEVAWAGPGEEAAKAAGYDVVVAKHQFRSNSRAQILGELDGLVKVIAKKNPDGTAGQVLGVHMVGPWVTEQLSGGYLAVNWEATVAEVAEFIQPHPSLSELFGETMLSLTGRSLNA
jgi:dihydrolipoamide dehydrogenase